MSGIWEARDRCVALCRQRLDDGATRADILAFLYQPGSFAHEQRPEPLKALMVLLALYGVDLHAALDMLCESPDWAPYARHIYS